MNEMLKAINITDIYIFITWCYVRKIVKHWQLKILIIKTWRFHRA